MFDCAAHWKGDEAFSSRYVPFSDVKSQKRTGETYSLDEVPCCTLVANVFGNWQSATQDSPGLAWHVCKLQIPRQNAFNACWCLIVASLRNATYSALLMFL